MNLQQFYTLIGDHSGKKGAIDRVIPSVVRNSIQFLEKNYDLNYMRKVDRKTLTARTLGLRAGFYKKIIRVYGVSVGTDTTETYRDIPVIRRNQLLSSELNSDPTGYFIWGDTLTFDGWQATSIVDIYSVKYTDLDCLKPADTHPLIDYYEAALLNFSMMNLAPYANEPDWLQTYGALWKMHQDVLVAAQDEFDYSGSPEEWAMQPT